MEIGQLTDIAAREAWQHEARDFTPWLAANLPQLGQAVGLPLELTGIEVAVESFSADILARNLLDDSVVLIENQIETSDHKHLGQILTYLAGLKATTVIWLATGFRPSHRSAIKWLNDNTSDGFSFFAVQLRVVRIGNSAAAPIFEVVEQPNLWERDLKTIARKSEAPSELGGFRKAFWEAYLNRQPQDADLGFTTGGASSNWVPVDREGTVIVSAWVGQAMVGLFVRGSRNAAGAVRELLDPYREPLEQALGAKFDATRAEDFLSRKKRIDLTDQDNWPEAIDWLHENVLQYRNTLRQILPETTA